MSQSRHSHYQIHPVFLQRWSSRAFVPEPIAEQELLRVLEAARWAPSALNSQPWRFVYARRDDAVWPLWLGLLSEYNQSWARHASALVLIVSKKTFTPPYQHQAVGISSHSFDSGAAWGFLALQAEWAGYATHAIGGFDREQTRRLLEIPEDYHLEAFVAIGRRGDKSQLIAELQSREAPNQRRPLSQFYAVGKFDFADV